MRALPLVFILLFGCSSEAPSGPPSVAETSAARPNLQDRVAFIEQYVTFRRTYRRLEYDVVYQNNSGGGVPGPSDWDVRLLAVVPAGEIDTWVPAEAVPIDSVSRSWLRAMPGSLATGGVTEWYAKGSHVVIGVDRARSTVAYRSTTSGVHQTKTDTVTPYDG